jgi:multiple sugar transport system substrate-binding protein
MSESRRPGAQVLRCATAALWLAVLCLNTACTDRGGAARAAPNRQVTLVNFTRDTPSIYKTTVELEREFERRNPDIRIDNINIPNSDYFVKLLSMAAANAAPDMALFDTMNFSNYVSRGLLLDLTPYLERDRDISLDDFFSTAVERCRYKGRIFGIPTDTAVALPFYNKDLFDQAGIPYPDDDWTWDDLLSTAKRLTRDTNGDGSIDVWGLGSVPWVESLLSRGGALVDDPVNPTRSLLSSPESIAALQWLADFSLRHKVTPAASQLSYATTDDLFMSGKIAITVTGHWLVPRYRTAPKLRFDVAAMPTGKSGKAVLNFGSCYSIPANSRHPDEAWRLVKFFASEECGRRLASIGYFTPANKKVAASGEFLNSGRPPAGEQKFVDAMAYARPFPLFAQTSQMFDILSQEVDVVFNGEKTAAEVCPVLAKRIDQMLETARRSAR